MNDSLKLLAAYLLSFLPVASPRIENLLWKWSGKRINKRLGQRKLLELHARRHHQAVYMGSNRLLCRVLGRYRIWADATDCGVTPRLALDGCWESWVTMVILQVVKPGMVCLDVGANHGYYSIIMADLVGPAGRIISFEPNPVLAELIRASAYSNSMQERIVVSQSAVADTIGTKVQLCHFPGQSMNANLTAEIPDGGHHFETTTVTLDSYCQNLPNVDLIKIDTEGAEESVWDGMQTLLSKNPRIMIVLEFNCHKYTNPAAFLHKIRTRFPVIRSIEQDGRYYEVSDPYLLDSSHTADWMLYLAV